MRGLSGLHHNESTPQMYFYCGALALQGSVWSRQTGCWDGHYYACKEQGLAERGGQRRKESRRLRLELSNCGSSGLQSLYQCQSRASSSHLERLFSPPFSPPPTRKTHSLTPKAITLLFSLPPLSLPLPLLSISLFLSPSLSLFVYCERCIKLKVCRLRAWSAWANHWSGWNYDRISAKQVHENLLCSRSSIGNHRGM